MRTFKYNIDGHEVAITVSALQGTVARMTVDGAQPELTESERDHIAAVIALALAQHELEVVHDDETDVITLSHHDTAWNAPARL